MALPTIQYRWTWMQDTGWPAVSLTCRWGGKKWGFLATVTSDISLRRFDGLVRRCALAAIKTIIAMELTGTTTGDEAFRKIQRQRSQRLAIEFSRRLREWEAKQARKPKQRRA